MKKILVIAAHPDDEVLGAGGTLRKHTKNGDDVKVVILGEGLTSRGNTSKEELDTLKMNSKNALHKLGVKKISYYSFPDNSFDTVSLLKIIKVIEKELVEFNPDIIYTHYYGDLNIDHQITYKAVITATRPINYGGEVLCFEIPSSTEQGVQIQQATFTPNYYVNIDNEIEDKVNALKEYKSEIREYPHPRSEEGIKIYARYRGLFAGMRYAEAFIRVRSYWR